ncbi:MAG: hypothetical protein KBI46_03735 [Phycisphaerae bacterium]|nr:hypothetical protein [Phycisphaerae bacterium]
MKAKCHFFATVYFLWIVLACLLTAAAFADEYPDSFNNQAAASGASVLLKNGPVRYRLIEGSTLLDECLFCDRLSVPVPIRGTFWLVPKEPDMWFLHFAVRNLRFNSSRTDVRYFGLLEGDYEIGGDFAFVHRMTLQGSINNNQGLSFDSGVVFPTMGLPWIEIELEQCKPDDPLHVFRLHLTAVPWPQVGFSTAAGFHPSVRTVLDKTYISDGDLLTVHGRILRTNAQLTSRLGIMPLVPDVGLDAVIGARWPQLTSRDCKCRTFWFSMEQDIFSEILGPLHQGDLLSEAGFIVRRFTDFIRPFCPQPPVPDYGLDAVTFSPSGRLLFSVEKGFFSESLGVMISPGDLLSEDGRIYRTNAQLLKQFETAQSSVGEYQDVGLDAVYVWPHGEIWFSTEKDFADKRFGWIGHGDLLSDTGRIIARNRELTAPFKPIEDLADFGLDALHIVWPILRADINGDGIVNLDDFAAFSNYWSLQTDNAADVCDYNIDLSKDYAVNAQDLTVFADDWLLCAE